MIRKQLRRHIFCDYKTDFEESLKKHNREKQTGYVNVVTWPLKMIAN